MKLFGRPPGFPSGAILPQRRHRAPLERHSGQLRNLYAYPRNLAARDPRSSGVTPVSSWASLPVQSPPTYCDTTTACGTDPRLRRRPRCSLCLPDAAVPAMRWALPRSLRSCRPPLMATLPGLPAYAYPRLMVPYQVWVDKPSPSGARAISSATSSAIAYASAIEDQHRGQLCQYLTGDNIQTRNHRRVINRRKSQRGESSKTGRSTSARRLPRMVAWPPLSRTWSRRHSTANTIGRPTNFARLRPENCSYLSPSRHRACALDALNPP